MIKDVVVELLTPVQRNFNVEVKSIRKSTEDHDGQIARMADFSKRAQKQIDELNVTLIRTLKNNCMDNEMLNREIKRLQEIDRLKVTYAKDVFYNPDNGSILPNLDTCHASVSDVARSFN